MPTYVYKAKRGPGEPEEGELTAESESAALSSLDGMGYSPLWIKETRGRHQARRRSRRVVPRDVTLFTRQLASLLKSGVPILRALSTVGAQAENVRFQGIVEGISSGIGGGNTFSGTLSAYPRLFPALYISMVKAGESAGALDRVLFRLAEAREKEEEMRRKVQAAVAYPALILCVGIATVFVLLAFFLPRVTALFKDFSQLPAPTRALIMVSDFFAESWYWIVIVLTLIVVLFNRLAAMEKGKIFADRLRLHMPLLKDFILYADVARFARTLALLIDSGIPISKALSLSANTLRNSVLVDEILKVQNETIQQGRTLSGGLARTRYFPVLLSNMTAVGEETGRIDESLIEVAAYYESQIEQKGRLATSLLEPLLILAVGGIVGFIVAAMLLPVFELGTGL